MDRGVSASLGGGDITRTEEEEVAGTTGRATDLMPEQSWDLIFPSPPPPGWEQGTATTGGQACRIAPTLNPYGFELR